MARRSAAKPVRRSSGVWDLVKTVFWALVIAGLFRTVLFQPFSIPSGSMKPTLLVGDYLFVTKYSYGYSRYSLPFSPEWFGDLVGERVFGGIDEPQRGDVIVFKHPKKDSCTRGILDYGQDLIRLLTSTSKPSEDDDCVDYVKRLVGLPGDRIRVTDGVLHVNGVAAGMQRNGEFAEPRALVPRSPCSERRTPSQGLTLCVAEEWIETLPGGVEHAILNADNNGGPLDNTEEFLVPDGMFFFMGDHRDNSTDSRFQIQVGFVPFENLIGRADLILLSSEGSFLEFWKWRSDRFFKSIQ